MKCRDCRYMEWFPGDTYMCLNPDSMNYMVETGLCCEDDCPDGEEDDDEW